MNCQGAAEAADGTEVPYSGAPAVQEWCGNTVWFCQPTFWGGIHHRQECLFHCESTTKYDRGSIGAVAKNRNESIATPKKRFYIQPGIPT